MMDTTRDTLYLDASSEGICVWPWEVDMRYLGGAMGFYFESLDKTRAFHSGLATARRGHTGTNRDFYIDANELL